MSTTSTSRRVAIGVAVATLVTPLIMAGAANAAPPTPKARAGDGLTAPAGLGKPLPAPPRPPSGRPTLPAGYKAPTALTTPGKPRVGAISAAAPAAAPAAAALPAQAKTWGSGQPGTLVLYDTTNTFGWLGELYAMAAGNLASHFGSVTAEPVTSYQPGQVNNFNSTIYIGSTYDEPLPKAFLDDVVAPTTTKPVIWAAANVWQLSGAANSAQSVAFQAKYGWDPSTSYFDTTDNVTSISYKGRPFTRNIANGPNVLAPHIIAPTPPNTSPVTVLATAACTDGAGAAVNCAPIAQSGGTSFPWAIRSANLTYLGEVPFSFMSETDRYLIFADLLFAPGAPESHKALVRLEDVNPTSDPTALRQFADYLFSQGVPFSVGVIPQYTDPKGAFNNGVPRTITLAQAPTVVSALKYMRTKGGTLIQHGTTHQFGTLNNPYNGVTGDDAEFYRAQCSATKSPPYSTTCQNSDWVIWTGPVPNDSSAWAAGRVSSGRSLFTQAGLPAPTIWETPHYFASPADYGINNGTTRTGISSVYTTRYEREMFVGGQLSGNTLNYDHAFGQFFPYSVTDVYGAKVIPENLGNYEPDVSNNNPPRLPAQIIANAQANLGVTQGVASFFFHPDYPLSQLQAIVPGIKNLGYTFVPATGVG